MTARNTSKAGSHFSYLIYAYDLMENGNYAMR